MTARFTKKVRAIPTKAGRYVAVRNIKVFKVFKFRYSYANGAVFTGPKRVIRQMIVPIGAKIVVPYGSRGDKFRTDKMILRSRLVGGFSGLYHLLDWKVGLNEERNLDPNIKNDCAVGLHASKTMKQAKLWR